MVSVGMCQHQLINGGDIGLLQLLKKLVVDLALFAILIVFIIASINQDSLAARLNEDSISLPHIQYLDCQAVASCLCLCRFRLLTCT